MFEFVPKNRQGIFCRDNAELRIASGTTFSGNV